MKTVFLLIITCLLGILSGCSYLGNTIKEGVHEDIMQAKQEINQNIIEYCQVKTKKE